MADASEKMDSGESDSPVQVESARTMNGHYTNEDQAPVPYVSLQFIGIFVASSLAYYAGVLGMSTSWNQLRSGVAESIGETSAGVNWALPTLVFTHTAGAFFLGRLTDYIGRRWPFVFANLIAFVGFIAAGRATSSKTFSGLNCLIGVGTGLQIQTPFLALAELVPVDHRFFVTSLNVAALSPLFALYPAISEALTLHAHDSWRWAYSINAIISFVAFALLLVFYYPPTASQQDELRTTSDGAPPKKDWIGLSVFTTVFAVFIYVVLWGNGTIYAWDKPQVIVLVTIFGLLFVLILAWMYIRGGEDAFFPGYILQSWDIWSWQFLSAWISMLYWFLPLAAGGCLQTVFLESGMTLAWDIAKWSAGLASGYIFAVIALYRFKAIKWQMCVAEAVAMTFLLPICIIQAGRHNHLIAFITVAGFFIGYGIIVSHTASPLMARKRDLGLVQGTIAALRGLIFTLLYALFETIYTTRLENQLESQVSTAAVSVGLPESSLQDLFEAIEAIEGGGSESALLQVPGFTETMINPIFAAVVSASSNAWRFILLIALVMFIPMWLFPFRLSHVDQFLTKDVWARLNPIGVKSVRRR
ncbi:hypothetical protein SEUCBS140593_006022 [Sporothrix eucalyptigena]|uniref:Major facilitator superfamily (MFS) profile domain-containing protein n=1 Tax=Sporothrix eucalyptigena TaxID=1812306 RepID=A0ABP0C1C7_9PEZI